MNVLQVIQAFCGRTGLPSPSYVAGNTDLQVLQLLALLNEVGEDLTGRAYKWKVLTREASFLTVATEVQGTLTTLAPFAFRSIIEDTIFNRTRNLKVFGPVNNADWQAVKSAGFTGTVANYRIRGGQLLFIPAPTAGDSCYFEYTSRAPFLAIDGVTYKEYADADTDTFILPARLALAGLRWKWKYEQGLDYAEDLITYSEAVATEIGLDGTKPTLSLAPDSRVGPSIQVALWNTVP